MINTKGSIPNSAQYVTEKQVSEITAISIKTLQGMRTRGGGIPYVKIGRLVRYDLAKVHEYMNKHTKMFTSQE